MVFFYDHIPRETTDNNIVRNKLINNGQKKKKLRVTKVRPLLRSSVESFSVKTVKISNEAKTDVRFAFGKPISNVTVFGMSRFSVSRYWKKRRKIDFDSVLNLGRENIPSSESSCNDAERRTVKFSDYNFFTFKTTQ